MVEIATTPTAPPAAPPPAAAPPAAPEGAASRPGVISDSQFDRLDPAEQGKYARVRAGPDGGSVWQDRATLPTETADPTKPATGDMATTPALVPQQRYQFGDLELSGQQILDLLKHKGETDLRRAAVPADPSQYKIEAKDVVLPPGMDWRFNEADPALAAARTWAHSVGLTQDQFAGLLGQYASMEAAKEATFQNAMKGELEKLGANATLRVTRFRRGSMALSVENWQSHSAPVFSAKSRCVVSSCSPTKWLHRATPHSARRTASRLIRTRARSPRCPKSTTTHFPQRKNSASAGWANRRSLCLEMKSSEAAQRHATPPSAE
jgi:hypothetical protein